MNCRLAITMGDSAGIGPEIAVKAFEQKEVYNRCIPIVIGDYEAMQDAVRFTGSALSLNVIQAPAEAKGQYGAIDLIDLGCFKKGRGNIKR